MTWSVDLQVAPSVEMALDINGTDLMPYRVDWTLRWPWHGKATWDLSAWWTPDGQSWTNEPSEFVPPGFGDFAGLIRHHAWDERRKLTYSVRVAGVSMQPMTLLPLGPSCDGHLLNWGGEDLTAIFEQEGTNLPDILMDQGMIVSAHTAMRAMAALKNITVECRFPNFNIRVLRRGRGRLLDFMDAIGRVYQCGRRWEGRTLVYEPAKLRAARRAYKDNLVMEAWFVEERFDQVKNQHTITRFEPVAGIIGEQEATGAGAVGMVGHVDFDPASRTCYPEIRTNMDLQDFVFMDEAGEPLTGNVGGIYAGAFPAKSVKFNSIPITPRSVVPPGSAGPQGDASGAYTPYFEIVFSGSGKGAGAAYDSQYQFTADDSATQAVYGTVPDYANLEDPIIPTAAVAEAYAEAVLAESVRHLYRGVLRTSYLDPAVRPGDTVAVTDYLTRQAGTLWFVDSVTHILGAGGLARMELELSRGL